MSDTKDFLRHPPQGIELKQRLSFEGIWYSIRAIQIAFERLESDSLPFTKDRSSKANLDPTGLFLEAWSIVDRADSLIQLLLVESKRISTPPIKKFLSKYSAVRNLRNKMNHLAQNLNNLADSKSNQPPIYGALSFVHATPTKDGKIKKASVILLTAGSFKNKSTLPVANPAGRSLKVPVGLFQIAAFNEQISLSGLFKDAIELREYFEKELAPMVRDKVVQEAKKKGIDVKEALSPAMEGLHVIMDVEFNS